MPNSARMANTEKVTPINKRAEANRANAQKSTGPRTEAGKERSRLNALKHGLTSQLTVLPTESTEAYQASLAQHVSMFLPATDQERVLVETIAKTKWRLNRCGTLEENLFVLSRLEQAPENDAEANLADAITFDELSNTFLKLSVYEQRLQRIYQTTKKELAEVQETRRRVSQYEYNDAVKINNLHIEKGLDFAPPQFGFVYPLEVFEMLMRREDAEEGELDEPIAPPPNQPNPEENYHI